MQFASGSGFYVNRMDVRMNSQVNVACPDTLWSKNRYIYGEIHYSEINGAYFDEIWISGHLKTYECHSVIVAYTSMAKPE